MGGWEGLLCLWWIGAVLGGSRGAVVSWYSHQHWADMEVTFFYWEGGGGGFETGVYGDF